MIRQQRMSILRCSVEDLYAYCGTPAGDGFRFGQSEKSITRFLGFDIQRDPRGFIFTQIPLIASEKIFQVQSAKKHMKFGTADGQ